VTRIIPDLQCSLLCEEVRQEANGNPLIIGVLSALRAGQMPMPPIKIVCFNRWTAGVGEFTESVKIVAPDGSTEISSTKMKFNLEKPELTHTNVQMGVFEFKEAGTYHVEISVDDVLKLRYPFPIVLVNPQGKPQQPEQPAED